MKNTKGKSLGTGLEKYPLHFQQALLLIAGVLRRIKEKRVAKGEEKSFINSKPEGGKNYDN